MLKNPFLRSTFITANEILKHGAIDVFSKFSITENVEASSLSVSGKTDWR